MIWDEFSRGLRFTHGCFFIPPFLPLLEFEIGEAEQDYGDILYYEKSNTRVSALGMISMLLSTVMRPVTVAAEDVRGRVRRRTRLFVEGDDSPFASIYKKSGKPTVAAIWDRTFSVSCYTLSFCGRKPSVEY